MKINILKLVFAVFFFLVVAIGSTLQPAMAQAPEEEISHSVFVMGVPQHLFNNGIRIETDWRIGQSNKWITAAPVFYFRDQRGNSFWGNNDVVNMHGGGLELFYRWYPAGFINGNGFYVSLGGGYQYVNQRFSGYRWETYDENGLTFFMYDDSPWDRISQTGTVKVFGGYMLTAYDYFGIDAFIGFGGKFSSQTIPDDVLYARTSNSYSFGGNGFLLVLGVRVGVGW